MDSTTQDSTYKYTRIVYVETHTQTHTVVHTRKVRHFGNTHDDDVTDVNDKTWREATEVPKQQQQGEGRGSTEKIGHISGGGGQNWGRGFGLLDVEVE